MLLMAAPHFPVHVLELSVSIQGANLALAQGDPETMERDAQGSPVGHRCRQLLEPTRHNPGPTAYRAFAFLVAY
jgi:hypothetical protein